MMNKGFLLVGIMLLASGSVLADPSKQVGVYIAGAGGATYWDDDNSLPDHLGMDEGDTTWQASAGYKFSRNFAVDVRYADLGDYSVASNTYDFTAWSVNAVGIIPLANSGWELYGQLGLGKVDGDSSCCGNDDKESLITVGGGVRYNLNRHWSLSGQGDIYSFDSNANNQSYDSLIYTLTAGIQYIFE